MANGLVVRGNPLKCSWGNKLTLPGTSSKPLPPPVASYEPVAMAGAPQGFTAAELLDYQRQLALSQAAAEHPAGQHILVGYVPAGLLTADTQALYDSYLNQSSAQWCSLGREDGSRHVTRCIDREKIAALLKFRDRYFLMVVLEIVYLAAVLTSFSFSKLFVPNKLG